MSEFTCSKCEATGLLEEEGTYYNVYDELWCEKCFGEYFNVDLDDMLCQCERPSWSPFHDYYGCYHILWKSKDEHVLVVELEPDEFDATSVEIIIQWKEKIDSRTAAGIVDGMVSRFLLDFASDEWRERLFGIVSEGHWNQHWKERSAIQSLLDGIEFFQNDVPNTLHLSTSHLDEYDRIFERINAQIQQCR